MKVILQERIANWGDVGDQVNVKAGFARNYLLPRGSAVQATPENIVAFEKRRAELVKKAAATLAAAKERAEKLEGLAITISAQASEEGKLFGSVGPRDIAKSVNDVGHELEKSEVEMPEGPVRAVGEYTITLHLHGEVSAKIKVTVNPA